MGIRTIIILQKWKLRKVNNYYNICGVDKDLNFINIDTVISLQDKGDHYILDSLSMTKIKLFKKDRLDG